ncbi:MAG: DNA polymerase III subunit delta [Flavobacteriales bacterium]|nr:DNA polymerase III subunit delta [Flavobacteriales bacterium]
MDHYQILREIELKKYSPIYLLMGEEPYFIDLVTDALEEKVLTEAERAFGLNIVYGKDVSLHQVLTLARSFPMMGDKQIVMVKEAQDLKEWKKAEELEILEAYAKSTLASTILVFAYKGKTVDKRLKVTKAIDKAGTMMTSDRIKEYKVAEWIEGYVGHKGYKIEPKASNLLAEYLGTDLGKVVNEVGKLLIIIPKEKMITTHHIEENIGISKDYNVWELQKALGQKDVLKSNRIINYFEANPKANPIQMVIPSLYGYFSKLSMYQSLADKKNAASELGMNPYAINDYKVAANNFAPVKVERIIHSLREVDRKSKGVDNFSVEDGALMRELVFKILH